MRLLRLGVIAAAAAMIGLAANLSPAQSQIEVRPVEVRPVMPGPTPALPAPTLQPLTPSYAPALPLPATPLPAPAAALPAVRQALPVISAGPPPNSCRPRTVGECAAEAVSCLAARGISDGYYVAGEGGATAIYRNRDDASQQRAEAAGDCAQDLQRCLAGGC